MYNPHQLLRAVERAVWTRIQEGHWDSHAQAQSCFDVYRNLAKAAAILQHINLELVVTLPKEPVPEQGTLLGAKRKAKWATP